jgi:hypothetical protein
MRAGWMTTFLAISPISRATIQMSIRGGVKKGDSLASSDLLNSGQLSARNRLTLVYHAWLETSSQY